MTATNPGRTRAVLDLVLEERVAQEARYGGANLTIVSGSGPEVRWLAPVSGLGATELQKVLRRDYEEFEDETGAPTWVHLVREEIAEVFQEDDPARLAEELIQVAALCVSWAERLGTVSCGACGSPDGVHKLGDGRLCTDCLKATL